MAILVLYGGGRSFVVARLFVARLVVARLIVVVCLIVARLVVGRLVVAVGWALVLLFHTGVALFSTIG